MVLRYNFIIKLQGDMIYNSAGTAAVGTQKDTQLCFVPIGIFCGH